VREREKEKKNTKSAFFRGISIPGRRRRRRSE